MKRLLWVLLLAAIAVSPLVFAADAAPTDKDAVTSARAVRLSEKLRCLVCQNQTIADSNADLAEDLRRQIHEQIAAGKTDDEILAYMVARYGDFVLYQPPVKSTTLLLWAGPLLLVAIGSVVLVRTVSSRRRGEERALTAEEHERAAQLLASGRGTDAA